MVLATVAHYYYRHFSHHKDFQMFAEYIILEPTNELFIQSKFSSHSVPATS